MTKFDELLSILKKHHTFIITSHVNPDADAIGSEIAIAGVLEQLGKEYFILNTSTTPYNLEFLDTKNIISKFDDEIHSEIFEKADCAIFLDLNYVNRTVRMEESFKNFNGKMICIDHHTKPENFADFQIIDESKSSTGEIIFDFINEIEELKFTEDIATAIYSAIMTDTGSFRFSKTTAALHRKIAVLLELGLKPEIIHDKIYAQYDFSRVKLLGEGLHSICISESGKVSYMVVTQESLKISGGIESDVDGFVNFALTTKGVKIGILFFELHDGVKISFRSKDDIPANKLAAEFGGGGHLNAAGTRLFNTRLDDVMPKVLKSADMILEKL